ncbi:MAG TPA: SHOCT domain-containing protein [Acidiferrobacter sp.]|nr:SHOCT domain-containing protein [Acidiferrobacter sp.]
MKTKDALPQGRVFRWFALMMGLVTAPVLVYAQTAVTAVPDPSSTIQSGPVMPVHHGYGIVSGACPYYHHGYWGHGMTGGLGPFWALLSVLVVVAIIWGVIGLLHGAFACRRRRGCRAALGDQENVARRLLDERYARGEIDRDEYLKKRADLEK